MNKMMRRHNNNISPNRRNKGTETWKIIIGNINSFPCGVDGTNKYKLDTMKNWLREQATQILL